MFNTILSIREPANVNKRTCPHPGIAKQVFVLNTGDSYFCLAFELRLSENNNAKWRVKIIIGILPLVLFSAVQKFVKGKSSRSGEKYVSKGVQHYKENYNYSSDSM